MGVQRLAVAAIFGLITTWVVPGGSAGADGPARPDILMIAIDDLNDWVGCLGGHPQVQTPQIDRLAARGTLFTNAHCQSPLCNPSRSSIFTGLRPSTTGIYGLKPGFRAVEGLEDWVTLPQYLAANGYSTFAAGKVYHDGALTPRDKAREIQVWGPAPGMPRPPEKFVETPDANRLVDWGVFPPDDHDQADWKIADAGIERLEAIQDDDTPFFVAVGFRLPHVPCYASQRWFDLYPDESLVMPPFRADDRDDVPTFAWFLHWSLPEPRLSWLEKANQWRPLVQAYLASTSFMDSQVGRVLDALDATGRADRTVVVLWSDHGWHLGEKAITGKNTLWERSTRVPLIFAGPGIAAGARCDRPAELLDMYPTLVELAGLPERPGLEGHSLVPQLRDAGSPRPWPAITTHNQGNHTVRTDRWRYIRYADGSEELYDHRSDPDEFINLAADPDHAEIRGELARRLPKPDVPPAPGSAQRILTREGGVWLWEGEPIVPGETIP